MDNDEAAKIRNMIKTQVISPELLELENVLLRLKGSESDLSLTEDEKMNLARIYHQAWWLWNELATRYYSEDKRLPKLSAFIFPQHKGAAERSLESLMSPDAISNYDSKFRITLSESSANAYKFLNKRKAKSGSSTSKKSLADLKVDFKANTRTLHVGDDCIEIRGRNDFRLLEALFRIKKGVVMDWDVAYEAMTGTASEASGKPEIAVERRMVRDAGARINKKLQTVCNTDDVLISWIDNQLRRKY